MTGYWQLGGAALGAFVSVFFLVGVTAQDRVSANAAVNDRLAFLAQPAERVVTGTGVRGDAAERRLEKAERAFRMERAREILKAREAMERREQMAMVHLLRGLHAQRVGR